MSLTSFRLAVCAACLAAAPAAAAPPAEDAPPAPVASFGPALSNEPTYIQMQPALVSVQRDFQARGLLHVTFALDAAERSEVPLIRALTPRLRHAHMAALMSYSAGEFAYGELPDPDRIKDLLQEATDTALGANVAEVHLVSIQIQDN
jgi:hypothetical protein